MDFENIDDRHVHVIRDFMEACREYNEAIAEELVENANSSNDSRLLNEAMLVPNVRHPIIDDLIDVVDDLRSFMESHGGEFAYGVETGMQRAADTIEMIIKRYEDK